MQKKGVVAGVCLGGMPRGQTTVAQIFREVLLVFFGVKHTYCMSNAFYIYFYYMMNELIQLIHHRGGIYV